MKYRIFASALVVAGTLSAGAASAATEILFNVFTGPQHFVNDPFKEWAKDVSSVTQGRVTVKFLPTSAAPPPRQIDGVVGGQYDAAFIFHGFTAKRAVGPQFGILPFLQLGSAEISSVAYWRTYEKHFGAKNEFGKIGIRILSMFQFPGGIFHSGDDKPIMSIADMKTRKMWALAGTPSRTMKAAGVNHVSGPAARVSEFTQTNVVDGLVSMSFDAIKAFGALSFVKHTTVTARKMQAPSFAMFISEKKWQQISPADQKAILAISGEKVARAVGKRSDQAEIDGRANAEKAGIKIHNAPKAFEDELEKAGAFLIGDWLKSAKAKGADGPAVLSMYKAEQEKLLAGK